MRKFLAIISFVSFLLLFEPNVSPAFAQNSGFCQRVPILMYHHVSSSAAAKSGGWSKLNVDNGVFDHQMEYLNSHGYTTISADQLAQSLVSRQPLPSKSVVLTFDDGYQDFYTDAYPIIQKYGLNANLMIPTGLINNPAYLSWQQLKDMVNGGHVFAYDHTWSHAALAKASQSKLEFEILTAKSQLESQLGRNVSVFAYPYGSLSSAVINFLAAHGFTAAFTTNPGTSQCSSSVLSLHRTRIGNAQLSRYGI